MTRSALLAVVGAICFGVGGALFLVGGSGLAFALVAFALGTLALVGFQLLRRRAPRPTAGSNPAPIGPSRGGGIAAGVGLALGALALVLALSVAEGEARGHGIFHLLFGAVALGLFVAVDRWWRPLEGTTGASLRTPVLVLLWVGAAGAFLESIGAAGYDRFNAGHRIEALTTVHNSATILGPISLLMVPVGIAVLAAAFVGRRRARASASA